MKLKLYISDLLGPNKISRAERALAQWLCLASGSKYRTQNANTLFIFQKCRVSRLIRRELDTSIGLDPDSFFNAQCKHTFAREISLRQPRKSKMVSLWRQFGIMKISNAAFADRQSLTRQGSGNIKLFLCNRYGDSMICFQTRLNYNHLFISYLVLYSSLCLIGWIRGPEFPPPNPTL